MGQGQKGKADWEAWTAAGLAGLAIFPLIGSVIALLTAFPRRPLQLGCLVFFGLVSVCGLDRLHVYKTFVDPRRGGRALLLGLVATGLIGVFVVSAITRGAEPTPYAWVAALMTILWLVAVGSSVVLRNGTNEAVKGNRGGEGGGFTWFLCMLIGGIALTAYARGPEDSSQVWIAFGGSYIQAGTGAAILAALALVTLQGWNKYLAVLFAVYLVFVSTSRTGLLIFLVLSMSILVTRAKYERVLVRSDARPRTARDALLLLVCVILVVAPGVFRVNHYPYMSSTGHERERVWEGMHLTYSRATRLVPGDWTPEAARSADIRWRILLDSANVVIQQPAGYWPREFQTVARTSCGPEACTYPHNMLLEIGYDFGWVPLALVAIGVLFWASRALGTLARSSALPLKVAGIGFLGQLVFAQMSGNLLDHSVALLLGAFWLTTYALPRRERVLDVGTQHIDPNDEVW